MIETTVALDDTSLDDTSLDDTSLDDTSLDDTSLDDASLDDTSLDAQHRALLRIHRGAPSNDGLQRAVHAFAPPLVIVCTRFVATHTSIAARPIAQHLSSLLLRS